jgi:tol-pal system protein YbgF
MIFSKNRTLSVILIIFFSSGCSSASPVNDSISVKASKASELEQRLQTLERATQNQNIVNLVRQINAAEKNSDQMQGRIEEIEFNMKTISDRQRQLYLDIDMRIEELASTIRMLNSLNIVEDNDLISSQPLILDGSDQDNYQLAFKLLKDRQYEAAASAFMQFLNVFPDSKLANNAQYWLAETYFVTQKFTKALNEFEIVISKYLNSRKAPDALLKIGYCYYELKDWDAARESLIRVQMEFPNTTAARLAGQRLLLIEEEITK